MQTYTFYLHDGPDEIPAFEIELFEERALALNFARRLLADRPRYDLVVVVEEETEVARFDRPAPLATPSNRHGGESVAL
jgi:hypothetical protein